MPKSPSRMIEGKPIVDASRSVVISIRTTDIRYAVGKAPDACAAAIACVRQLDESISARVHRWRTYVEYGDRWVRYVTSPELREEIITFDKGEGFSPGIYKLGKVPPSHSTEKQRERTQNRRPHRGSHSKKPTTLTTVRGRPDFHKEAVPHAPSIVFDHSMEKK